MHSPILAHGDAPGRAKIDTQIAETCSEHIRVLELLEGQQAAIRSGAGAKLVHVADEIGPQLESGKELEPVPGLELQAQPGDVVLDLGFVVEDGHMALESSIGLELAQEPVTLIATRAGCIAHHELRTASVSNPDTLVVVAPGLTEQTALRAHLRRERYATRGVGAAIFLPTGLRLACQQLCIRSCGIIL